MTAIAERVRGWFGAPVGGGAARVPVPTVLQMEAVECGAACVGMVLAHHERYVSLEELRGACGVSRNGSKASHLVRGAEAYGLTVVAYKKEPAELRKLPVPSILHWKLNHYVVLEGFARGKVFINDPSRGAVTVTDAELDKSFSGVVLTFAPGPEFTTGGKPPHLVRSLIPWLNGTRAGLIFVLVAGLALLVPGMAVPAFVRVFVDSILVRSLHDWLRPLLLFMAGTLIVQAVLTWLQQQHLLRLETALSLRSSGEFFWHVLRLPYQFFVHRSAGDIASRVQLGDRVARLLSTELATTVLDLMLVALYGLLMLQYDVVLTLIGVSTAMLNLLLVKYTAQKRKDISRGVMQERGKLMGIAMSGLQSIETLKATASEGEFFSRWSGQLARVLSSYQRLGLVVVALTPLPALLLSVNTALMLGLGGLRIMDGELSIGMLLALQALMLAFLTPINRVLVVGTQLHEVQSGLMRLDDVLQARTDPHAPKGTSAEPPPEAADKLAGLVELRNITFGYSRFDPPLIEDLSLTLQPGSRVALVGKSGSGKSTIARMVAGLHEPWEGEILFDGRPRSQVPREVMHDSLAMVEQEIFLFEGTVRENVTLWNATIPEIDAVDALRDASIYDEVALRSGGLMSAVQEGGRNFSGGQRQRLEISRALAGRPSILVLDEATSALDPLTEMSIDDHLRRRGCTCLIVAHRLSTIRDCDEIIVLDRGKIVQRGIHDEMVQVPGPYRELVDSD